MSADQEENPAKTETPADTASNKPILLTTDAILKSVLDAKYGNATLKLGDLSRLHLAVENFASTLIQAVIDNRRPTVVQPKAKGSRRKGNARYSSEELWRAFALTPSLRPIALRFLTAGLVPDIYRPLFQQAMPLENAEEPEEPEEYGEDEDEDADINPLLFGPSVGP